MKATMTSTTAIVDVPAGKARVWEGVSESGVPFVAYIVRCQVHKALDNSEFEQDLHEHKLPDAATSRAIDARMIL